MVQKPLVVRRSRLLTSSSAASMRAFSELGIGAAAGCTGSVASLPRSVCVVLPSGAQEKPARQSAGIAKTKIRRRALIVNTRASRPPGPGRFLGARRVLLNPRGDGLFLATA